MTAPAGPNPNCRKRARIVESAKRIKMRKCSVLLQCRTILENNIIMTEKGNRKTSQLLKMYIQKKLTFDTYWNTSWMIIFHALRKIEFEFYQATYSYERWSSFRRLNNLNVKNKNKLYKAKNHFKEEYR